MVKSVCLLRFFKDCKNELQTFLPHSIRSDFFVLVHVFVVSSCRTIHQSKQNNFDDSPEKGPFHPIKITEEEKQFNKI